MTDVFRFIGPVPVPPRATGGHMGPPLRKKWNVIPFNRHRRLSKRGSPRTAIPTASIGGNPKPATRAAVGSGPYGIDWKQSKNCRGGHMCPPVPRPRRAGKYNLRRSRNLLESPLLVGGGQGGSERERTDRTEKTGSVLDTSRLVRLKGLEPPISRFVAAHSIQLSYRRV